VPPTASISSDEDDARAILLPCSNMSRTRLAPTPTNISTKSDPEIVKNGHCFAGGWRAGEQCLTGAGRPTSSTPSDSCAQPLKLCGSFQVLDDLLEFLLGLIDAGDILERDAPRLFGQEARPALPNPSPGRPLASAA